MVCGPPVVPSLQDGNLRQLKTKFSCSPRVKKETTLEVPSYALWPKLLPGAMLELLRPIIRTGCVQHLEQVCSEMQTKAVEFLAFRSSLCVLCFTLLGTCE